MPHGRDGGDAGSTDDVGAGRVGGLLAGARRLGANLALRSPVASGLTRRLYWAVGPRLTAATYDCDLDDYAVPLDPFRLVQVDPALIRRLSRRPFPPDAGARDRFGRVRGGDWDRRTIEETPASSPVRHLFDGPILTETSLYEMVESCVLGSQDPLEHPFGREVADRLAHGEFPVWGDCRTPADVRDRVQALTGTAGRMLSADAGNSWLEGGLPTQHDRAIAGDPESRRRDFRDARAAEILVDVARDGELLAAGGLERLCLARALGIDRVPVAILVRHDCWVAECEWRWLEEEPLGDHPDCWALASARSFCRPTEFDPTYDDAVRREVESD